MRAKGATPFLMVIPFFTSDLVRIYSWQIILSDNGIINVILGGIGLGPFQMLNTVGATMIGYLTLAFPLVVLLQLFSLVFIDRTLIEAAHNMHCGRLRTVFEVVIPSARTGLVIAALFCFILAFGDFVSPVYLGGDEPTTLSILITDTTKSGQQWPRAAVIALTMIGTLMIVAFAGFLQGQVSPRINAIGTFVFILSMTLVILAQLLLSGRVAKPADQE